MLLQRDQPDHRGGGPALPDHHLSAPLLLISLILTLGHTLGNNDAQLIQEYEGQGHDGLAHPVRRRGDDRGYKEDSDIGVFPVRTKEIGGYQPNAGQHIADQGQLEGHARADDNVYKIFDIIVQGRLGDNAAGSANGVIV